MADENSDLDLFGDPFEPTNAARGRPEHKWTHERSNRVLLCFVRGLTHAETARVLGIDAKTLRKHYSRECDEKRIAGLKYEQLQLERLNREAQSGSVTAEKALRDMLDKFRMRDRAKKQAAPSPRPQKPLGKKDQALRAAREQEGIFTPPSGPQQLN